MLTVIPGLFQDLGKDSFLTLYTDLSSISIVYVPEPGPPSGGGGRGSAIPMVIVNITKNENKTNGMNL